MTDPRRVLLITSMFPPYCGGGVSSHVRDLAASLAKTDREVWVLTSRRGQPVDPHEARGRPPDVRVVYAPNFRRMVTRFGRLLRDVGFDVVHFHAFNALALAPLGRRAPGASVFTLHSDSANYLASVRGWTRRHPAYRAMRMYEKLAITFPDATIAVSRRMQEYGEGIGARRIVHIPNAVDLDYWSPPPDSHDRGRTIVVPRMHVPKNGIEFAIRAMERILVEVPDTTLQITGDGPLRPSLEAIAGRISSERIRFLGMVAPEELRDLYRRATAVMVPSITVSGTQENTSIAALEAMACGTPVIATAIGGLPEVVRDGLDGFLVPERRADALADAALLLLRDDALARRMGDEARRHVGAEFGVAAWCDRVTRVYAAALQGNGWTGEPAAGI